MTVAAIPAAEMAGAEAGGAVVGRAGAGKVVDAKVIKSKPLNGRNTRTRDTATGAGIGSMLDMPGGRRKSSSPRGGSARRLLIAEFVVCMVVLAFSPLTGKTTSTTAAGFMKRGSAIMGLFFVLGLISTAGRGASRAAAGFGGLVTLVLLISDRSIFTKLTSKFAPGTGEDETDLGGLDAQDELDTDDTDEVPDAGIRPVPNLGD